MGNPNIGEIAKTHPRSGKRGKNKTTIAKEKALENAYNTWAEGIIDKLPELTKIQLEEALKGKNFKERKDVMDRLIGKPKEKVEISGPDGGAIEIEMHIIKAIKKVYGEDADGDGGGESGSDS